MILPTIAEWGFVAPKGEEVPDGFAYRSDTNDQWLDVPALRDLIEKFA